MMNINHSHLHFWKYFDIFLKKNFFGKFRSKFTIHLCWGFVVFFCSLMGFVVFEVTHYLFWEFSLLFFTCWVFFWPFFSIFAFFCLIFLCSCSFLCCFSAVLGPLFVVLYVLSYLVDYFFGFFWEFSDISYCFLRVELRLWSMLDIFWVTDVFLVKYCFQTAIEFIMKHLSWPLGNFKYYNHLQYLHHYWLDCDENMAKLTYGYNTYS